MKTRICATVLTSALATVACFAQAEKTASQEEHFYRLDYVLKEVDEGKVLNSRSYSTMISTGHVAEIRTGNKVPFKAEKGPDYLEVGVNIDARKPRELENQLALEITGEVSNLPPGETASGNLPLLRQDRWQADVLLPLRRPVVVFSSDDPGSTHKIQLEITATPVK